MVGMCGGYGLLWAGLNVAAHHGFWGTVCVKGQEGGMREAHSTIRLKEASVT